MLNVLCINNLKCGHNCKCNEQPSITHTFWICVDNLHKRADVVNSGE